MTYIILGLIYNNCPIQWRIPLYLTLLGFSEIGVSLLDLFHYVIKRCTGHNQNAIHATVDNVITQVDPKKSDNLAFAIIYYLLIVFRLIWFIAGLFVAINHYKTLLNYNAYMIRKKYSISL